MGILKKISDTLFATIEDRSGKNTHELRKCYFEVMEQRRVLSADPVVAGITFREGDAGLDTGPDFFEVSFQGGSATTQLTQFTINGDQDLSGGWSLGDIIFDVNGAGAGGFFPFKFDAINSVGITEQDILEVRVSDNLLSLTVTLQNFFAGDILAFTVDVDEVERLRVDMLVSGVEMEGSFFEARFEDAHYTFNRQDVNIQMDHSQGFVQSQWSGMFFDDYDALFAEGNRLSNGTLGLKPDNFDDQANRTAGAIDVYQLVPRAISISGSVYHDENLNCVRDSGEQGISNVQITLQRLSESNGQFVTVAQTQTDSQGNYQFGKELNLMPGTFQIVQSQPEGFLSVGARPGTHGGSVVFDLNNDPNIIRSVIIPQGGMLASNYDFCEVRPAEICGTVWHDANNDGVLDSSEERIGGVVIQLFDAQGQLLAETRTDAQGQYCFAGLLPGEYNVQQIQPFGFLDGKDSIGVVLSTNGSSSQQGELKTNDRFGGIVLRAGDRGVNYNFGELRPASISGFVHADINGNCVFEPSLGDRPLANVTLLLLNEAGFEIARTLTDANGEYLFDDLMPGNYAIRQLQPAGYLDGSVKVGTVGGSPVGNFGQNLVSQIVLSSGQAAVNYDFCEHIPAEICGAVFHDRNNDGIRDANEEGIANVRIVLLDAQGNPVRETVTDALGNYCFRDLIPGEYCVQQIQPLGWVDGKDSAGFVNGSQRGTASNDQFCRIAVMGGDQARDYNFGELLFSEISGFVHVDANQNCLFDIQQGDRPLAGVTLELLDQSGNWIASTLTDSDGHYVFGGLLPGVYSIRQIQPAGFFSAGETTGNGGGLAATNSLSGIVVASGQRLTQYNFCELEPAVIQGQVWEDGPAFRTEDGSLPANYRSQRDGIFDPAVDTPIAGVKMHLYYYIDPAALADPEFVGDLRPRKVTLADVLPEFYGYLGTSDPNAPIWAVTDASGQYWFRGLKPGSYIVLQEQPEGYYDANDFPGSTTGFSFNSVTATATAPQSVLSMFSTSQIMDSIINIQVQSGVTSLNNNFSEVRVETLPPTRPLVIPPLDTPIPRFGQPVTPQPGITGFPGLAGAIDPGLRTYVGPSERSLSVQNPANPNAYTWHLSVINGGTPRHETDGLETGSVWQQVGHITGQEWARFSMNEATWIFSDSDQQGGFVVSNRRVEFGTPKGIPLAGDFNGDGIDQLAVFKEGNWYIDINNNGIWDDRDLLIKLGDERDRPVIGDWDGDGKDDIGIYGPMWESDPEAIARDPGLPNPDNRLTSRPKNVPPHDQEATNRARVMKLTSYGKQRADVVDHVFGFGEAGLIPVAGDWNGNGIRSIGTFKDGLWQLDLNGDGKFDHHDAKLRFGEAGDLPVVGDFNGDGIDQIAVFRSGTWIIDSNGNRELDATDYTFQMGAAGDLPLAGDWTGDGMDQPTVYRPGARPVY
jgi:serine-aspartate repeat-containing protein C/D/E